MLRNNNNARPSVPSSSKVSNYGGIGGNLRAEGAKNLWVRTGHQWNLTIGTYNVRSLRTDDRLTELETELDNMKWDVMGLCEVRRPGTLWTTLKSGHHLFHSGNDISQAGVGFLIHKSLAGNVVEVKGISDRICLLVLQLNSRCKLNIVQVYAPTSSHDDETIEAFYDRLAETVESCKGNLTYLVGDFNAKVGQKEYDERVVGKFGLGERNVRGQRLVDFAARSNMRIMNTFFKKPNGRKWTWQGPNATVKNEIDYILATRPDTVKDINVISRVNTGSDHRPVTAKVKINTRCERVKMVKREKAIDRTNLFEQSEEFQVQLSNRFELLSPIDNIESQCSKLTELIKETSEAVAGCARRSKAQKLSRTTLDLMKIRREMKRDGGIQNIEYREVCKTLRKKVREDCRKYNTAVITEKIRNNKSVKKGRREVAEGTNRISCVLSKAGQPITNQDDILKRIEEFYTDLYASALQDTATQEIGEPADPLPDITASEVRHSLGKMSNDKAVGADGISIEAMKAGDAVLHRELAKLFTNCLKQNKTPDNWKSSRMVLIHKKGDNRNLKNYRPISILSNVYKLYTKVLTTRLQRQLDDNQPPEQAGFRSGYSTMDHIHAINQLREKCTEYQKPLCIALVDFEKAFDSVETRAVAYSPPWESRAYKKSTLVLWPRFTPEVTLPPPYTRKAITSRFVRVFAKETQSLPSCSQPVSRTSSETLIGIT